MAGADVAWFSDAARGLLLPSDPAVRTHVFESGLRLVMRPCAYPANKLCVWLEVGAGSAAVAFETAPGACYLAVLGAGRGDVRGLSLSAEVDGLPVHDEGGGGRDGLALTFCARRAAQVPLQIDARGSGLLWGLAIWRLPTSGEVSR